MVISLSITGPIPLMLNLEIHLSPTISLEDFDDEKEVAILANGSIEKAMISFAHGNINDEQHSTKKPKNKEK